MAPPGIARLLLIAVLFAPAPAVFSQTEQERSDRTLIQKVGDLFKGDPEKKAARRDRREERRAARRRDKDIVVSGEAVYYKGLDVGLALGAVERDLERKRERLRQVEEREPKKRDPDRIVRLQHEILELENRKRALEGVRGAALGTPPEETEHDLEESSLERESIGRGVGTADALERAFAENHGAPQGDDTDGAGLGAEEAIAGRAAGEAGGSGGSADPSRPSTKKDLLLASNAGFKPSFEKHGLKVGPGPGGAPEILRDAGTPASADEVDALRRQVLSDPKALMKRPDFFEVLPRRQFESLKSLYKKEPGLKKDEFRDVGLTRRDRDFLWERSCTRLSGQCNKNTGQVSYQRGSFVAPEDLGRMGAATARNRPELAESEDFAWGEIDEDLETTRAKRGLSGSLGGGGGGAGWAGSILGRLAAFRARLSGGFPPEDGAGALEPENRPGNLNEAGDARGVKIRPGASPERTVPAAPSVPDAAPGGRGPGSWILAFAAGALLILFGLRRTE